jgi:hypothetical protein
VNIELTPARSKSGETVGVTVALVNKTAEPIKPDLP